MVIDLDEPVNGLMVWIPDIRLISGNVVNVSK